MRITFGKFKGYEIYIKAGRNLRPTLSRVRDVLFNTLADTSDLTFVDLFAGTGIVGIEALSLGCKVIFVEKKSSLCVQIKNNLSRLKVTNYKVLNKDFRKAIKTLQAIKIFPEIIFCDPPYYKKGIYADIFDSVHKIIKKGTLLIIESSKKKNILMNNSFTLVKSKHISNTHLFFYRKEK